MKTNAIPIIIVAVLIGVIALARGIHSNALAELDEEQRAALRMQVTADTANIRSGPGTEHEIVTKASRGDLVLKLLPGEGWTKVQLADGRVGWIANSLLGEPGSVNKSARRSSTSPWHKGGTLHNANALQWQKASYANKLATCSDFIEKKWKKKELLPQMTWEIRTMDDIKPFAEELVSFIDDAVLPANGAPADRKLMADTNISRVASSGMVLMGWIH